MHKKEMIQAIFKIRLKQIYRITKGIGIIRWAFLMGLFGFIAYVLFKQTGIFPNSYYSIGIYMTMIFLFQTNRNDKSFLKIHFNNYKLILLLEYTLLLIPLLICLIYYNYWILTISVIVFTSLIINLNFKLRQKSINSFIQKLIPSNCFEWKSGIRKTLFVIIAFWTIGLFTSFFIGSVPVVLFILGLFPLSFYDKAEPIQMILSHEMGTNKFLFYKIKMQLTLFTILSFPLIIAFLIFHIDRWYIPIVEFIILSTTHIYLVLTKYAFYKTNSKSSGAQAFGVIGTLGIIMPVFIPLVWLLSIRFYFKSLKNLNFYLNDYN